MDWIYSEEYILWGSTGISSLYHNETVNHNSVLCKLLLYNCLHNRSIWPIILHCSSNEILRKWCKYGIGTRSVHTLYIQYGNEVSRHTIYSMGMRPVHTLYIQYGNEATSAQCSHKNLQAKGTNLMTTPLILNVVTVSTKHLLLVYHCQQSFSVKFSVHWVLYWGSRQLISSSSLSGC